MLETEPITKLLKDEIESWKPFVDALRAEDRAVVKDLMEECWRYASAMESSKKKYMVEPFFLSILLILGRKVGWLESEVQLLREEIDVWKSKAGS